MLAATARRLTAVCSSSDSRRCPFHDWYLYLVLVLVHGRTGLQAHVQADPKNAPQQRMKRM